MKKATRFLKMSAAAIILFASTNVLAQTVIGTVSDGHFTPDGIFDSVSDGRGHKFSLGEIAISDTIRYGLTKHMSPTTVSSCSPGYFKVFLEAGCGMEDMTKSDHVARLNVLCQVLTDISNFISSPGTGQFVNLWVRPEVSGSVLGVGTPFFNVPRSSTVSGIADNAMWITINSGKDAFINVAAPITTSGGGVSGSSYFHGSIAFNWDPAISWTTSLTTTPAAGDVDLYTVALHEMMHVLGIASLIDDNGHSVIGSSWPYYSRYDSKLQTAGGTALIPSSSASTCDLYNRSFNSSLSTSILSPGGCPTSHVNYSNCATAINFVGATVTIPVYTPDCFELGSSLSHFEDECYTPSGFTVSPSNDQYFLMSNSSPPLTTAYSSSYPGVMKRYLKPEERSVLCDIGYSVSSSFGNAVNHNDFNYGSSCGYSVAGINDGLTGGSFTFISTPSIPKIDINPPSSPTKQLLYNDNATSFKCLEVIIGDGTLVDGANVPVDHGNNTTNIYFVPGPTAHGLQLIRYIPVDGTHEGNITYVYVYVLDATCPASVCNFVSNGGFESTGSTTDCWTTFTGSPDRFYTGAFGYGIPNTSFLCCTPSETGVHPLSTSNNAFLGW